VANGYLANRLDVLRRAQRPDGGWAFYEGKQNSWLEPTVYAALALHGSKEANRAMALVEAWQRAEGNWKVAANVDLANWTSALAVLLRTTQGLPAKGGCEWLVKAARERGWAWMDGGHAAAEPTAWSLLALTKAGAASAELRDGAKRSLLDQPIRPENCGQVMLGLQGTQGQNLKAMAHYWLTNSDSALTRAWLTLGLRLNGATLSDIEDAPVPGNLAAVALEALGARAGNFELLKVAA
jgi:hypothetical protein